ncbi:MAG: hypothetical protein Q7S36_03415 [Candidatus Liptonbacteria bacterium]|nr:hypothetical protein [Candidatus Liptonbacteria bacterium]
MDNFELTQEQEFNAEQEGAEAKKTLLEKKESDFFASAVNNAAIELATQRAKREKFSQSAFDVNLRWEIQRGMESFLAENPDIKIQLYGNPDVDEILARVYESVIEDKEKRSI